MDQPHMKWLREPEQSFLIKKCGDDHEKLKIVLEEMIQYKRRVEVDAKKREKEENELILQEPAEEQEGPRLRSDGAVGLKGWNEPGGGDNDEWNPAKGHDESDDDDDGKWKPPTPSPKRRRTEAARGRGGGRSSAQNQGGQGRAGHVASSSRPTTAGKHVQRPGTKSTSATRPSIGVKPYTMGSRTMSTSAPTTDAKSPQETTSGTKSSKTTAIGDRTPQRSSQSSPQAKSAEKPAAGKRKREDSP